MAKSKNRNNYFKKYYKENLVRVRAIKLKWYYKNRDTVNMMMSKPKMGEGDEKFLFI